MFRLFDPGLGSLVGVVFVGATEQARGHLAEVVRRLGPQVDHVVLVTDGPREALDDFGLPVLSDADGGGVGPLAGIAAAFAFAAANVPRARGLLTAPSDAATLPPDFATRIAGAEPTRIAVASVGNALQPLFAYWPTAARDEVRAALARGETRVKHAIEALPHRVVDLPTVVSGP